MKKRLVALMTATMLLAGCGGAAETDNAAESTQVASTQEVASTEAQSAESTVATEAKEETGSTEYVAGTYTETGYESPFVGYLFTTPEGCVLASEEEILAMAGIADEIAKEEVGDIFKEQIDIAMVYEMYAQMPSGANVNVGVQTLDPQGFTTEQVVESVIPQYSLMEDMKMSVRDERGYEEFIGQEFYKITIDTEYDGYSLVQEQYYTFIGDKYIIITFSGADGMDADVEALKNAFQAL